MDKACVIERAPIGILSVAGIEIAGDGGFIECV